MIDAAPSMLAALKECVGAFKAQSKASGSTYWAAWSQAEIAIASAERSSAKAVSHEA